VKIQIVTPSPRGSRGGNRVTALRWASQWRRLGHKPRVREKIDGESCDVLVALHARKSSAAITASRRDAPSRPIILVLTGTDIYEDLGSSKEVLRSLDLADRIVVLQDAALDELPKALRAKTAVIWQSARAPKGNVQLDKQHFAVLVIAHLRPIKDPLLAARAARRLPASSTVRVQLVGRAMDPDLGDEARQEEACNPRFVWLGPKRYAETQALLQASRVLVLSSYNEGGPAVISEAVAAGVPILSTRMPASLALLGEAYTGFFECGDEAALAALMERSETEPEFLASLHEQTISRRELVSPETERMSLRRLLAHRKP